MKQAFCKIIFSISISVAIIIKILIMPVYAASAAAPVIGAAGEAALAALFGSILVACGFVEADALSSMTDEEIQAESKKLFATYEIADLAVLSKGKDIFLSSLLADTYLAKWLVDFALGQENEIVGTPMVDMHGATAMMITVNTKTKNYNVRVSNKSGQILYNYKGADCMAVLPGCFFTERIFSEYPNDFPTSFPERSTTLRVEEFYPTFSTSSGEGYTLLFGSWKYEDETEAPTDDAYDKSIGQTEDGTRITIDMLNPDGTATVDGVDMPVDFDSDAFPSDSLWDFIRDLFDYWDNSMPRTDSSELADSTIESVGDVALDIEELEGLTVPSGIISVFPFCIPWDFVTGIKLLSSSPVTPRFEIPFNIPSIGSFGGREYSVVLDFSDYDSYFQIFRWLEMIFFSITLCFISFKIVKGVG